MFIARISYIVCRISYLRSRCPCTCLIKIKTKIVGAVREPPLYLIIILYLLPPFESKYHFNIDALVIHVFGMSNANPINRIVKICFSISENDCTIISAAVIATIEVRVIVIPVLRAPRSFVFVSSCLFSNRVVSIMSESTE